MEQRDSQGDSSMELDEQLCVFIGEDSEEGYRMHEHAAHYKNKPLLR